MNCGEMDICYEFEDIGEKSEHIYAWSQLQSENVRTQNVYGVKKWLSNKICLLYQQSNNA